MNSVLYVLQGRVITVSFLCSDTLSLFIVTQLQSHICLRGGGGVSPLRRPCGSLYGVGGLPNRRGGSSEVTGL